MQNITGEVAIRGFFGGNAKNVKVGNSTMN